MTEVRVGAFGEFPDGGVVRRDVGGHRIAIARIGDQLFAVGDRCTHAEASLSEGDVDAGACSIECPRHGASFSLETGAALTLPATKPVPVYAVRVADGDVMVEVR